LSLLGYHTTTRNGEAVLRQGIDDKDYRIFYLFQV
jgi:hypothetical protein